MKQLKSCIVLLMLIGLSISGFSQKFENLIKGDLSNWEIKGGEATYDLKDGIITGTTKLRTPNTFLCTKKLYSDFILEYEYKFKDPNRLFNSGVQIRTNSFPEYNNGRVHGYQVEIDPSDRGWASGIYEEGRRGWLYNLNHDLKARKAFNKDIWNKVRVEAIGSTIRTWLNGVPCANLVDDMTAKGFIGLQVHGIGGNKKLVGNQIQWRNIKIATSDLEAHRKPTTAREICTIDNKLSKYEIENNWVSLFDGKSVEQWRGIKLKHFPRKGWKIENGELIVEAADGAESGNGGDIVTRDQYESFIFECDFKITKGANSGIKYFVTGKYGSKMSAIGLEFQVLDDKNHPDAKKGVKGNRTIGSLYDLIPAKSDKKVAKIGQWNHAKLVVKGDYVEHWLNGRLVVEYQRNTQAFNALVAYSKYKNYEGFGNWKRGHLLLQDHGDEVHYKNIKIKKL
jgi:hypothetical protein